MRETLELNEIQKSQLFIEEISGQATIIRFGMKFNADITSEKIFAGLKVSVKATSILNAELDRNRFKLTFIESENHNYNIVEKNLGNIDSRAIINLFIDESSIQIHDKGYSYYGEICTTCEGIILLFSVHHAIFDAKSVELFINRTNRAIKGEQLKKDNVIEYQQANKSFNKLMMASDKNISYWKSVRERFKGHSPVCFRGDWGYTQISDWISVEPPVSVDIRSLWYISQVALALGLTLNSYSFSFISPIALRGNKVLRNAMGCYINSVPVSVDFDKKMSPIDLYTQFKEDFLESVRHSAIPFNSIVKIIDPDRSGDLCPITDIVINYQNFKTEDLSEDEKFLNIVDQVPQYSVVVDILDYYTNGIEISVRMKKATRLLPLTCFNMVIKYLFENSFCLVEEIEKHVLYKVIPDFQNLPFRIQTKNTPDEQVNSDCLVATIIKEFLLKNLNIEIENDALNRNLFSIGLESLTAIDLYEKLQKIGYDLKLIDIFNNNTINSLSGFLSKKI
ncbi:MAG: hypothetical protein CENE_00164 [Candidatus Celerinatantimonas neptuna]|nr:MAG: hypothetical protein CENE_00164 [Candidatus Celerinatantimonas neptuna]